MALRRSSLMDRLKPGGVTQPLVIPAGHDVALFQRAAAARMQIGVAQCLDFRLEPEAHPQRALAAARPFGGQPGRRPASR